MITDLMRMIKSHTKSCIFSLTFHRLIKFTCGGGINFMNMIIMIFHYTIIMVCCHLDWLSCSPFPALLILILIVSSYPSDFRCLSTAAYGMRQTLKLINNKEKCLFYISETVIHVPTRYSFFKKNLWGRNLRL